MVWTISFWRTTPLSQGVVVVTSPYRSLNAAKQEFDLHPIPISPDRAYSPASIAKGYLVGDKNVGRLDVPLDNANRMRSFERVRDINGQCEKTFYF